MDDTSASNTPSARYLRFACEHLRKQQPRRATMLQRIAFAQKHQGPLSDLRHCAARWSPEWEGGTQVSTTTAHPVLELSERPRPPNATLATKWATRVQVTHRARVTCTPRAGFLADNTRDGACSETPRITVGIATRHRATEAKMGRRNASKHRNHISRIGIVRTAAAAKCYAGY